MCALQIKTTSIFFSLICRSSSFKNQHVSTSSSRKFPVHIYLLVHPHTHTDTHPPIHTYTPTPTLCTTVADWDSCLCAATQCCNCRALATRRHLAAILMRSTSRLRHALTATQSSDRVEGGSTTSSSSFSSSSSSRSLGSSINSVWNLSCRFPVKNPNL